MFAFGCFIVIFLNSFWLHSQITSRGMSYTGFHFLRVFAAWNQKCAGEEVNVRVLCNLPSCPCSNLFMDIFHLPLMVFAPFDPALIE